MELQKPKTNKFAVNYGVILGIISIVFGVLLYIMEMHYHQGSEILIINLLIMAIMIFLAIHQFRKANGGIMDLVQAMKVGLGVALIGFLVGMIWQLIFTNLIEPDFMENLYEIKKNEVIAENPKVAKEQLEQMKTFFGPIANIAVGAFISIFFGSIFSLISGLILRKSDPAQNRI